MIESSSLDGRRLGIVMALVVSLLLASGLLFFMRIQSAAANNGGATTMFLKIDGISGDSQDPDHLNENEVKSFSWQETTVTANKGGGGGVGAKPTFGDLNVMTKSGKWSPQLLQNSAAGNHIKEVNLFAAQPGGGYVKIKLQDVLLTAYGTIGSDKDDSVMDQISMSYGKIFLDTMSADGSTGSAGWDVKANKKI